jgi:hypothetical protein
VISAKNVNTKINKVKLNPKKIAILSKRLPINLCGISKRYKVLITNRNDKTPMSKSNPVAKIFNKLTTDRSKSFNCQTKKAILNSNENKRNQPENPSKRAYRLEKMAPTFI